MKKKGSLIERVIKSTKDKKNCLIKLETLAHAYKHEIIHAMTTIIQELDAYTRDHSKNVANYALLLAEELRLPAAEIETIYYGSLFHDIGKIGISPVLLNKKGRLTPGEYTIIKKHPEKGAHILQKFSDFENIVPMVLHHHEMFDGRGYPDGLNGSQIPFNARLLAIVDAYDAITTNRSYRKARGCKYAIEVILKSTPQQFDPEIVQAFVRVEKNL